jgi:hypothetical protein
MGKMLRVGAWLGLAEVAASQSIPTGGADMRIGHVCDCKYEGSP